MTQVPPPHGEPDPASGPPTQPRRNPANSAWSAFLALFMLPQPIRRIAPAGLPWFVLGWIGLELLWQQRPGSVLQTANLLAVLGTWTVLGAAILAVARRVPVALRLCALFAAMAFLLQLIVNPMFDTLAVASKRLFATADPWSRRLALLIQTLPWWWASLALAWQGRRWGMSWARSAALLFTLLLATVWIGHQQAQFPLFKRPERPQPQPPRPALTEQQFYVQNHLFHDAIKRLPPQRPDQADIYVLAIAGDGNEGVFWRETELAEQRFRDNFGAHGSLLLQNRREQPLKTPLATATSIQHALNSLGQIIDTEQDVVLVYMTSHGSRDHQLVLQQPPMVFYWITPDWLNQAMDNAGIQHRIVMVSACYSGGFIAPLANPDTLVMTAAAADRTSFGCSDTAALTWFGRALLEESLARPTSLDLAFYDARRRIEQWEKAKGYQPSDPQIFIGERIGAKLLEMGMLSRLPHARETRLPQRRPATVPEAPPSR